MKTSWLRRLTRVSLRQTAIGLFTLCLLPLSVSAQDLTEKQRIATGKQLATQWCAHCHKISPDYSGNVQADVPAFAFIANKPEQTAEKIQNSILSPHPPMPDLRLSRDTVFNLALYILSLRDPGQN